MKCALCNERNGSTRCEGCNTLFCLPCMNKHHDKLAQQFQLLIDVRNEIKQSLDITQSTTSNKKQVSCLIEIDAWEREIIQRIQKIAANARNNVDELMMKHMNEISDRFEKMSAQMQHQQKEGDYLENDIERIKNQLDQLKNDIKHVNEKIRVDSSLSNNIEWDTLLYIVEEESPNPVTSEPMPTKDKVAKEKKKSLSIGRGKKVKDINDINDSSQLAFPTNQPVAGTSQPSSIPEYIEQSTSSSSAPIQRVNQSVLCILCNQLFDDWQSTRICPTCDYKIRYPSVYDDNLSRLNTRSGPKNMYLPTSNRDYTTGLSPVPKIRPLNKITCSHCKFDHLVDDISSNSHFHCFLCEQSTPFADLVAHPGNAGKK